MKLELQGMTKKFGPVVANDDISLVVKPGEIHSLLGENGAGKSTLMNLLYGLYQPDAGRILLDEKDVSFAGPGDAMAAGIGMVHQHFMLVPVFSVAENVVLGNEPTNSLGALDLATARNRVNEISARFGFDIDPDALIEDLPVGIQQRVEIVKALARDAKILILDEPTAVLTPQETDELMDIMRQLAAEGTSIVFITHKLREVKAVADVVTVIRGGKVIDSVSPETPVSELASLMVGREVDLSVDKKTAQPGEAVLRISDLVVVDERQQRVIDGVSLDVHAGEVLCIAGVEGNGQTALAETLLGLRAVASGSIALAGRDITHATVKEVLESGVGYVPEDRKKDGLVADFTIEENLMLDGSFSAPYTRGLSIDFLARRGRSQELIESFDVRTPSSKTLVKKLSGGNQQKVVVARELSRDLQLFVAAQPTRGVDVGSIEFIHESIIKTRDAGIPVVIISTELDEVYNLADRIAVMYRGKIVGIVPPTISREDMGQMMAGILPEGVAA
ncbi:ABC transporter ATP-binding protein [Pontimonas sp.]|nr:ABC transporter ATP-binding protein [Pontimonas sp.]MDA8579697.1 ABC transporter ATP-binding protein [Pontimonas sp.]